MYPIQRWCVTRRNITKLFCVDMPSFTAQWHDMNDGQGPGRFLNQGGTPTDVEIGETMFALLFEIKKQDKETRR